MSEANGTHTVSNANVTHTMTAITANINLSELILTPYKPKGRGKDGADCWGLVRLVYEAYGYALPDFDIHPDSSVKISKTIAHQKSNSRNWVKLDKPVAPSIAVIKGIQSRRDLLSHVGVYIGNGLVVHMKPTGVVVDKIYDPNFARTVDNWYVPSNQLKSE